MRGRNELAGGQTVVPPGYACGMWVGKPITSWVEKTTIINNNPFAALHSRSMTVLENVKKLTEFEQKEGEISREICRKN